VVVTVVKIQVFFEVGAVLFTKEKFEQEKCWSTTRVDTVQNPIRIENKVNSRHCDIP